METCDSPKLHTFCNMNVVIEGNCFADPVLMLDLPVCTTVDQLEDVYASFVASFGVSQPENNTIDNNGELVGSVVAYALLRVN